MNTPPWLMLAESHLGEHEIAGKPYNQFILDCFKWTNFKASNDEVPWCAAFVSRMLEETGYKGGHTAWALSYANVGEKCELKAGAIVVFMWPNGSGHVAFCHHEAGDLAYCLGGNQHNAVAITAFNKKHIIATRWPQKA